ncbi:MAG: hypothetical protein I3J02_02675 [Prevotella sp.]|nr:hypothetical protein [Prevotella sp.]
MKQLFILLLTLLGSAVAQAQETDVPTATLQAEGQVTTYYGSSALTSALAAAPDSGSTITLSSGTFYSATINKSVVLYGAGFEESVAQDSPRVVVPPTIITGDITISSGDQNKMLGEIIIEGINFNNTVNIRRINKLMMTKSAFGLIATTDTLGDVFLCQSYIKNLGGNGALIQNMLVQNSIIQYMRNTFVYDLPNTESSILFNHCLILDLGSKGLWPFVYNNSILDANGGKSLNYCIFTKSASDVGDGTKLNCWYSLNNEAIFGENGSLDIYGSQYSWKLVSPETYIGSDGTEVGLYGGEYPWNKTVSIPRIIESKVGKTTDADGKLAVSIKAQAQ